ncbi:MAG TPA: response regulator transcription factor [Chloroflexota bacterium]|nr:response regulator transcription factor [Chloroflexota bacterium]
MSRRILVVDDEENVVDFLRLGLQYEGFQVQVGTTGLQGLALVEADPPDLLILDVMLPLLDGVELCQRIRSRYRTTHLPIIMLTARDRVADRVEGLNAGADDYLVKPFAYEELLARVKALLRRTSAGADDDVVSHGGVVLDRPSRLASRDGRALQLTAREFDLLAVLVANAGRVLSRDTLLERVWGCEFEGESNVVDVYVHYLRQKLGPPNLIQAVRSVGFVCRS